MKFLFILMCATVVYAARSDEHRQKDEKMIINFKRRLFRWLQGL